MKEDFDTYTFRAAKPNFRHPVPRMECKTELSVETLCIGDIHMFQKDDTKTSGILSKELPRTKIRKCKT